MKKIKYQYITMKEIKEKKYVQEASDALDAVISD